GEPKAEELPRWLGAAEENIAGLDKDALGEGALGQAASIDARSLEPDTGRPRLAPPEQFWMMADKGILHYRLTLAHGTGEPLEVGFVVAERDEERGSALIVRRRVAQHQATQGAQLPGHRRRGDQIAEPQARGERLGE